MQLEGNAAMKIPKDNIPYHFLIDSDHGPEQVVVEICAPNYEKALEILQSEYGTEVIIISVNGQYHKDDKPKTPSIKGESAAETTGIAIGKNYLVKDKVEQLPVASFTLEDLVAAKETLNWG